jgi:hypothetical protein
MKTMMKFKMNNNIVYFCLSKYSSSNCDISKGLLARNSYADITSI